MTGFSSSASSMMDTEKHNTKDGQPNHGSLDPSHTQTEAAILPDTAHEGTPNDVEKGDVSAPPSKPTVFDPRQNPDGGTDAWLCVLGGFCVLFCSFGWINCIGVFQDYYQSHQLRSLPPSTIAWIGSLEAFFMFAGGPVIGKLYDNYGPRYLLLVGTFLHVFGLMMTSLATEYYQFLLAQGVCSPIGASMIFYPAMSTITTWFFKKRGAAFGMIAAGSSLGGVILPIMVQRLVNEVGFAWSMRITAFLILALMIVANLAIKSRIPPFKKPWGIMEFIVPLKELPFDLVTFGSFLFFMGMFLPINYIIVEAIQYGMKPTLAQYLVSILNAGSLFGRTIPGVLADKIGRYNMMMIMCFFTSILVLAMWLPSTGNAPIITFAALYGFGSGAFVSLAPSLIAQISDVRQIGVRTGTLFAIISIAALISNPIGGQLITRWQGSYTGLQVYCGVMTLAGSVFLALARVRLAGWKLSVKV